MVKKKFSLICTLLVFFIFIYPVSAEYTVPMYDSIGIQTSPVYLDTVSWRNPSGSTCTQTFDSFLTLSSPVSPFAHNEIYYSPNDTVYLLGELESFQNISFSCRPVGSGTISAIGDNNSNEFRVGVVQSSDYGGFIYVKNKWTCTSGNKFEMVYTPTTMVDEKGNTFYWINTSSAYTVIDNQFVDSCTNTQFTPIKPSGTLGCSDNVICDETLFFPINSSAGVIEADIRNIKVLCGQAVTFNGNHNTDLYLIRAEDGSAELISNMALNCPVGSSVNNWFNISFTRTVEDNELYFIAFRIEHGTSGAGSTLLLYPPTYTNVTLDGRNPIYDDCNDYSECINGSQFRVCSDTSGYGFPNKIFYNFCGDPITASEFFGFELFHEVDIAECEFGLVGINPCGDVPVSFPRKIPTGWNGDWTDGNVSGTIWKYLHYFEVSQEASRTAGNYHLKMWSLNPDVHITSSNISIGCVNSSVYGNFPTINNLFNLSVTTNLTFNTPNARLSYWVRAFDEPYVRSSPTGLCALAYGDRCYGSCNGNVTGQYRIYLKSNTTTLLDVYDTATTEWTEKTFDLSGTDLQPYLNYTFIIELPVSDFNDPVQKGIYLDDLYIQESIQPLNCSSYCDGADYVQGQLLPSGACYIQRIENYSSCYALTVTTVVNPIYVPPTWVDNLLNGTGTNTTALEEAGFGGILFLVTPFGLGIVVMLVLSALIEFFITRGKSNGMVFGIVTLALSIAFTFYGLFPIEWALLFVISSGVLVAYTMKNMISGGGG